jgi:hypothetical protein
MTGGISAAGDQQYALSQDGQLLYASILGVQVDPASISLHYSLVAHVHDLSATGQAKIHFVASSSDGQRVMLDGTVTINGMVPAKVFASGAVPSAFLGFLRGTVTTGGSSQPIALGVSLESPFINPFGGPIVVTTFDASNSIVLVTDYHVATIHYGNVKVLTLSVTGTLGSSAVTAGSATLTTRATEDLVAGTESETGTISFTGMNPSLLNSFDLFSGSSIIPSESQCLSTYGFASCTLDCTSYLPELMGVPSLDVPGLPAGLCTLTGFISSGSFHSIGAHVVISGTYTTVWDIPAVTFGVGIPPPLGGSTITGTVTSKS